MDKEYMGPSSLEKLSSLVKKDLASVEQGDVTDERLDAAVGKYLQQHPIEYQDLKGTPEKISNQQILDIINHRRKSNE